MMKTNIENKEIIEIEREHVEKLSEKFVNLWSNALNDNKSFKGLIDFNVVVDKSNSEIKADEFEIDYIKSVVSLYYHGIQIAIVKLINVEYIY